MWYRIYQLSESKYRLFYHSRQPFPARWFPILPFSCHQHTLDRRQNFLVLWSHWLAQVLETLEYSLFKIEIEQNAQEKQTFCFCCSLSRARNLFVVSIHCKGICSFLLAQVNVTIHIGMSWMMQGRRGEAEGFVGNPGSSLDEIWGWLCTPRARRAGERGRRLQTSRWHL